MLDELARRRDARARATAVVRANRAAAERALAEQRAANEQRWAEVEAEAEAAAAAAEAAALAGQAECECAEPVAKERAVEEEPERAALLQGVARSAQSRARFLQHQAERAAAEAERAAAEAERVAMEVERAAEALENRSLLQMPESEGDMPRDDFGDSNQALPGYTPGWRHSRHSLPSSPLSSPSVSVFGPGLGHQRDWGWDPGGVRAVGGGLGWDPGGARAASGQQQSAAAVRGSG